MNSKQFKCTFRGEELQLIDDLAKEYLCSQRELVSKSLLITREIVNGPNPFYCSWDEWYDHFRKMYEEAQMYNEEIE